MKKTRWTFAILFVILLASCPVLYMSVHEGKEVKLLDEKYIIHLSQCIQKENETYEFSKNLLVDGDYYRVIFFETEEQLQRIYIMNIATGEILENSHISEKVIFAQQMSTLGFGLDLERIQMQHSFIDDQINQISTHIDTLKKDDPQEIGIIGIFEQFLDNLKKISHQLKLIESRYQEYKDLMGASETSGLFSYKDAVGLQTIFSQFQEHFKETNNACQEILGLMEMYSSLFSEETHDIYNKFFSEMKSGGEENIVQFESFVADLEEEKQIHLDVLKSEIPGSFDVVENVVDADWKEVSIEIENFDISIEEENTHILLQLKFKNDGEESIEESAIYFVLYQESYISNLNIESQRPIESHDVEYGEYLFFREDGELYFYGLQLSWEWENSINPNEEDTLTFEFDYKGFITHKFPISKFPYDRDQMLIAMLFPTENLDISSIFIHLPKGRKLVVIGKRQWMGHEYNVAGYVKFLFFDPPKIEESARKLEVDPTDILSPDEVFRENVENLFGDRVKQIMGYEKYFPLTASDFEESEIFPPPFVLTSGFKVSRPSYLVIFADHERESAFTEFYTRMIFMFIFLLSIIFVSREFWPNIRLWRFLSAIIIVLFVSPWVTFIFKHEIIPYILFYVAAIAIVATFSANRIQKVGKDKLFVVIFLGFMFILSPHYLAGFAFYDVRIIEIIALSLLVAYVLDYAFERNLKESLKLSFPIFTYVFLLEIAWVPIILIDLENLCCYALIIIVYSLVPFYLLISRIIIKSSSRSHKASQILLTTLMLRIGSFFSHTFVVAFGLGFLERGVGKEWFISTILLIVIVTIYILFLKHTIEKLITSFRSKMISFLS